MFRNILISSVFLSLLAASALAAELPRFAVTAEATRSNGQIISVTLKITGNKTENVPEGGRESKILVTTTMTETRIIIKEGQRALLTTSTGSGDTKDDAKSTTPKKDPSEIDSGALIEVISLKGQDSVLVVTTVYEDGAIVWANASTFPITAKPATAPK